jgi:molybdenum cofactor cytidylyltransferase
MMFGACPLDAAEGAVLAHTQRLPGRVLKKGMVLDEAAIAALRAVGRDAVIAARLDPGDVSEDAAADRLADALLSPGLARSRAGTGRVNLSAAVAGLLRLDPARIERLNLLDESLTLGTLADYSTVAPREMVATIKVIPFAVPGRLVDAAERLAADGPMLWVLPFRPLRVGLVMTELPGMKESVLDGTVAATAARVAGLTGSLLPALRAPHAEAPIAEALHRLIGMGAELLLVAGASAVVDRRDVGPAGIVRAGGEILHFGMPVDPGNLICIGRIGARPALVLPGCARSPKLNGIDWVLSRLFAGETVGAAEIARMGAGGLLKDSDARPMPRARATEAARPAPAPRRPPPAAIVLAAGQSTRMAPRNKLLIEDASGRAMVTRVVDAVLGSAARPVLVVVGHMAAEVRAALGDRAVRVVAAEDYASGLSASLQAGLRAVPPDAPAALVCLGDMPLVTPAMIDMLIEAYDPDEGRTIVVPTSKGRPGNPILWDRRYFPEMLALAGDAGARRLLHRHMESVAEVEVGSEAVLRDFDTEASLRELGGE